jgi:hypothetical protein
MIGATFAYGVAGVLGVMLLFGLYLLPSIVAGARHIPNVGAVIVVNFFLGWTLVGWVVALVIAVRSVPRRR